MRDLQRLPEVLIHCNLRHLLGFGSGFRISIRGNHLLALSRPSLNIVSSPSRYQPLSTPQFQPRTMTTNIADAKIVLTPEKPGLMSFPGVTVESARTASELLQRNNAENHAFFNPRGMHIYTSYAGIALTSLVWLGFHVLPHSHSYLMYHIPDNLRTISSTLSWRLMTSVPPQPRSTASTPGRSNTSAPALRSRKRSL